jgi:hypothetical protein
MIRLFQMLVLDKRLGDEERGHNFEHCSYAGPSSGEMPCNGENCDAAKEQRRYRAGNAPVQSSAR